MANSDAYLLQVIRQEVPSLTDSNVALLKACIPALEAEVDSLERKVPVFEAILFNFYRTLAASR